MYVCEGTVGIDVGDGNTSLLILKSIARTLKTEKALLNHLIQTNGGRWWT
jgi:hypothetical protein